MTNRPDAECQAELLLRLSLLEASSAAMWGRMNSAQMVAHLSQSFQMVLTGPSVRVRWTPLRGPVGRYLILHSSLKWRPGFPTLPELDMVRNGYVPGDFAQARSELVERLHRFYASPQEKLLPKHPYFGAMRRVDWMAWGYRHTDHHLRQFGC